LFFKQFFTQNYKSNSLAFFALFHTNKFHPWYNVIRFIIFTLSEQLLTYFLFFAIIKKWRLRIEQSDS